MQKTNRIVALDWLRGFCAISIMLYHFFFLNTNDILFGKLGIYAVSTFFVISGLSMAIVYNGYIKGYKESVIFFSKRIFRIIPIYIIACILTILLDWLSKHNFRYSFTDIILNITTLFGLLNLSSGYIPAGGWSIGNEMCFYLLTPFILYLYDKRKVYGNLFLIAVCIIGLYFCFFLMKPDETINQWEIYINPLNNLFLFVAGIAIFYNFNKLKINQFLNMTILFISFTIFLLYPFSSYTQTGIMTECNGGGCISTSYRFIYKDRYNDRLE
jgi:peptidoglycan/LPS O-acetylase OafA/YrhL